MHSYISFIGLAVALAACGKPADPAATSAPPDGRPVIAIAVDDKGYMYKGAVIAE